MEWFEFSVKQPKVGEQIFLLRWDTKTGVYTVLLAIYNGVRSIKNDLFIISLARFSNLIPVFGVTSLTLSETSLYVTHNLFWAKIY